MCKFPKWAKPSIGLTFMMLCCLSSFAQGNRVIEGIGREATPREVAAWDIDVRPDLKGLPKGAGSVSAGQKVWESKCASCHGVFGESNEVFSPLIGGTTKEDIASGRVANLKRTDFPGRTTIMKVATVSTLWDYINRAMPWNAPKSLTTDEVYAVLAYMLNMAEIVPESFILSDKNMAQVQARMPNRNGMTTKHAMWPGTEFGGQDKPDTQNVACMSNCKKEVKVSSFLPDFARNNHGNLALQNRLVGAQRGVDTTKPQASVPQAATVLASASATGSKPAASSMAKVATDLLKKHNCLACHGMSNKVVGPGFTDIAKKHLGKADYIQSKIVQGGSGVWGPIPMPAQSLSKEDAQTIANWLADNMPK